MDLAKSQKLVKVLGIIDVVIGVLCLIAALGLLGLGGAGAAVADAADDSMINSIGVLLAGGIIMLICGVVSLLQGVFSLRAAKDATKAQPLWVISIIGIVTSVISLVANFNGGASTIASNVLSVAISCGIFYLANVIKKNA
jgi:hypothetical protein